jgi:two-component system, sensor histidine kinase and response regulator
MLKTTSYLILFFVVLAAQPIHAQQPIDKLTVMGIEDYAPLIFKAPDGTPSGLYFEIWKLWSKTTGIPVEFKFGPAGDNPSQLKNKNYAISFFKSPEREQFADFSIAIHAIQTGMVFRRGLPLDTSLKSPNALTIAVMRRSQQASYLAKNYPEHSLVFFTQVENALHRLYKGEIDVLVGELPIIRSAMAKLNYTGLLPVSHEVLYSEKVHAAIGKGQPELLEIINQGFNDIPVNKVIALEKQFLPSLKPYFETRTTLDRLTEQEKEWLLQHQTISVGIDDNLPPFEFVNEQGEFVGISADYLKYASDVLNITFTPRFDLTWLEAFEGLKQDRVDMMAAAIVTDNRKNLMFFTEPYIDMPTSLVVHKNTKDIEKLSDLNGKTLGLVEGDFTRYIDNDYSDIKMVKVGAVVEGFKRLQKQEYDAFIAPDHMAHYEINKRKMTDLKILPRTEYDLRLTIAVSPKMQPMVSILNKTFSSMPITERNRIDNTWRRSYVETGTKPVDILKWLVPTVVMFLLTIIYLISKSNQRLNRLLTRNRTLASRIVAIQEDERRTLSRDLHDDVGQNLTALRFHIGAAKNINDLSVLKGMINTIDEIADTTYQSSYELMHWLSPLVLDDYGLEHAVSNHVIVKLLEDANINYNISIDGDMTTLPNDIAANIYRIIQECITNAAKYSEANNLWLKLSYDTEQLEVIVKDDGKGFDIIEVLRNNFGLGISGIMDRLEAINGRYQFESNSSGTCYHFNIPINVDGALI